MKLVTFESDGVQFLGHYESDTQTVFPLSDSQSAYKSDMLSLIQTHPIIDNYLPIEKEGINLNRVKLKAPIPKPSKNIFCVGKNYFDHAQEFTQSGFDATSSRGDNIPDDPIIFTKAPTTIIANGDHIPSHQKLSNQIDYEAELAVIIGKGGSQISKEQAENHIFGYTIANDVTARDLQLKHRQWFLGKSLDGSCPMGPFISTSDETNWKNLNIKCWVNDELRQNANSNSLIFDVPTLIETISAGTTLEPGDIISTGTPAGVGIGFDPPRFLQPNDIIKIEIDGLGTLQNQVIE